MVSVSHFPFPLGGEAKEAAQHKSPKEGHALSRLSRLKQLRSPPLLSSPLSFPHGEMPSGVWSTRFRCVGTQWKPAGLCGPGGRARASGQKCESRPMSGSYDFGQLGSGGDVPVPELTYGSNEKFIEATL